MNDFLFVIALSPSASLTPFRKALTEISMQSLTGQQSRNWEAVLLGEESRDANNLHYMNLGGVSKEEKLHHFADWMMRQEQQPRYLIRFDDDDLISPFALKQLEGKDFDTYADRYHWFADTASGQLSRQLRPWLANTVVHKTSHALATFGEYHKGVFSADRKPVLLQNDHSRTWHVYYQGKKVIYAPADAPLYIRLLSPSSITAGKSAIFDKESYAAYRAGFGEWDAAVPAGFESYLERMNAAWTTYFGAQEHFSVPRSWRSRLKRLLGRG